MRTSTRTRLLAAATLAALAVTAACSGGSDDPGPGSGDTTGVTDTTVTIGGHYPLTGPAAPGYSKIGPAAKAFFDHVNEQGGINGRKIEFVYRDDAYNPAQTVQVVRELVLRDKVFAVMGGLGTHTKVVDFLNASKVPDLFVASGCLCWDEPEEHPNTYGWQPDYLREGKILGRYVAETFPGKRVAYFTQNDDFGQDGIRGLDQFVPAASVVTRQTYQPGNTDIGPQVSAIARAKADVVISFSIPAYTALLRLGTLKAGISPQLVVTNVGSDPVTLTGLLEAYAKEGGVAVKGADLIEGMVYDGYLPPYLGADAATDSWVSLFKEVHAKYLADVPFDGNVMYGMAQAYTFAQVLAEAGPDPTREGLREALDAGGLAGPGLTPFAFSADSHAGMTGVQVMRISGGVPTPQTGPQVTDGAEGEVTDYTATPATAPPDGVPANGK